MIVDSHKMLVTVPTVSFVGGFLVHHYILQNDVLQEALYFAFEIYDAIFVEYLHPRNQCGPSCGRSSQVIPTCPSGLLDPLFLSMPRTRASRQWHHYV